MPVESEMPRTDPWQWCWQCGSPLWDWSTVYELTTFFGRVALCRHCGPSQREARLMENRAGVLGYYDRETWKRAKNRGKQ